VGHLVHMETPSEAAGTIVDFLGGSSPGRADRQAPDSATTRSYSVTN
jgi:hypothetical protein